MYFSMPMLNKLKYTKQVLMKTFIQFYDKLYNMQTQIILSIPGSVQHLYAVGHTLFSKNIAGHIHSKNMHVGILYENSVFIIIMITY